MKIVLLLLHNCVWGYALPDSTQPVKLSAITATKSDTTAKKIAQTKPDEEEKVWILSLLAGLNLSHTVNINAPKGAGKQGFQTTNSLDIVSTYAKPEGRFGMTNELHWLFSLYVTDLRGSPVQKAADDLLTLHDYSVKLGPKSKWNANIIVKLNTSIFTTYNGDLLTDILNLGPIQSFFNPYDIRVSPGVKYQPSKYFRISLSPYAIRLYGVPNQKIANTGLYTTNKKPNGDYENMLTERLGGEVNIWYDRTFKKWLQLQYRLTISSNYFEKVLQNGLVSGLFITRFKLFNDLYLTHRATLKGNFANQPFSPFYSQTTLLSYSVNL